MSNQVNLVSTCLSFPGKGLQPWDNRHQQHHNNGSGDIGIDPHCGHTEPPHGAAAEHIEHTQQGVTFEKGLQGTLVHTGNRHVSDKTKDDQNTDGNQDAAS